MTTASRTKKWAAAAALVVAALATAACSPETPATSPSSGSTGGTSNSVSSYDDIIDSGPVASAATVKANAWASKIKQAGVLKVGGTETANLFSLVDPTTGKAKGFDAGISQLLARYIIGKPETKLQQVTVDTRETLLESNTVDTVIATYSITPARAKVVGFAGPYYGSQAGILVTSGNSSIKSLDDLAGKKVATQANSTGVSLLQKYAPKAQIVALPDHQQCVTALEQGNADAYVIDESLLLNAVISEKGKVKIVGKPFGPSDLYGIGVNKDSDAVDFINTFLKTIEQDGTWAKLWKNTIGDPTQVSDVPTPPTVGDTGL